MASTAALSAAAQDRKSRLAQLKSLKRKQEALQDESNEDLDTTAIEATPASDSEVSKYVSGRNYDFETKGAKLGFEAAPSDGKITLEKQASVLEQDVKKQAEEEEKEDKPLDLFKLQPKKPNWDLKRDLDRKLEILNVRTDNAIARLVRERIAQQQAAAKAKFDTQTGGDVEAAGIEGSTLVEATNVREREDEEDARREREEEDALLDAS
ncbi:hypothetical protein AMS68_002496 [Peltaster fructicola]|uniref:Cwf18 pre-mRNA splicing factor n=1 Tax=Peltaster fructicola TaxID=286661 RepID=A0A6H0XQT0_9PEZI|nr:hypothetical protein AMS68_002496 [Peltaster fructicola]